MRVGRLPLAAALLLCCAGPAGAQTSVRKDGTIVEQIPCAPNPVTTYVQYVASSQQGHAAEVEAAKREGFRMETPLTYLSEKEYQRLNDPSRIDCQRIKYLSDGLKVVGFIWRPKDQGNRRLPLIIFNRGGNREFGKLTPWQAVRRYALEGFVVIASQYRGNDGGEGREEFGGSDVRDVLNLVPLAESLGNIDTKNIFMLGWSRGGMMTYLAIKNHVPVQAGRRRPGGPCVRREEAARDGGQCLEQVDSGLRRAGRGVDARAVCGLLGGEN